MLLFRPHFIVLSPTEYCQSISSSTSSTCSMYLSDSHADLCSLQKAWWLSGRRPTDLTYQNHCRETRFQDVKRSACAETADVALGALYRRPHHRGRRSPGLATFLLPR